MKETIIKCKKERSMKSLQEDIKNQDFKQVYLLYGEENYLKQQYKQKLKKALIQEDDSMNFSMFEGKKIETKEVIDLAETMPFFSDRRVIFLEDTGFFKTQCVDLPEYIAELPEYICMVFIENDIDKRNKMYKAVKKYGRIVEFRVQDNNMIIRWILGMMKKEGKKITQKDMELFLSKTGTDMGNIERELEKLFCYTMGREIITAQDIENVCTTQITGHIFDMIQAVTEKNQKKALDLYYELLSLKEPPMRILFLLARQFNLIMQVKELSKSGYDISQIGKKVGIQPFVVKKCLGYAKKYSTEELKKAVEECILSETNVKTGLMTDTMSVELLLVKFSSVNHTDS